MSFLWQSFQSLIQSLFQSLGLAGKEGSLLLLGLDNAGKTTLLHRLKTGGDIRPFPPTDRPTLEEFTYRTSSSSSSLSVTGGATTTGRLQFKAWDLGGHEAVRHLWEDFVSTQVSAVLFVIDAADSERLEEAAYELDALVGEGLLKGIPVALLFNKCDLPQAMGTAELCERLEFARLQQEHGQTAADGKEQMAVFRISVLKGEGYNDAFRWVGSFL